jgi:hypothetical protein
MHRFINRFRSSSLVKATVYQKIVGSSPAWHTLFINLKDQ